MAPRTWPALTVRFTPPPGEAPAQDLVLAALDDLRVTAIDELEAGWRVFFSTATDREEAVAMLRRALPGAVDVAALDVADEDWARRSQENLQAITVGRVTIAPPWAAGPGSASQPDGPITVVIQPSMGFGTGHHASTRLCTALLQRVPVAGRSVIDVGTGSGVLALVAAALGARPVLALDDDPDAIESARENLALNGTPAAIELRVADFRGLRDVCADVVTANLTGALLVRGAPQLIGTVAPDGWLILSGVTLDEERSVVDAFEPALRPAARLVEDEWVGLLLTKAQGPWLRALAR
jgi:ribosomal protein L11 methyltransferase